MLPDARRRFLVLRRLALVLLLCAGGCAPKFERPNLTVTSIEMQGGNSLAAELPGEIPGAEPEPSARCR
jgi:hypothetical protein